MAKLKAFMASDDYQLACQAAVRASRLEFELKEGQMTLVLSPQDTPFGYVSSTDADVQSLPSSDSMESDGSDEDGDDRFDGDDSSTFDQRIVSATVCPDGDMTRDHIATLNMTAIVDRQVNKATFRDDIMDTILDCEPLAYDLLSHCGTFRSDTWGRGSPNEGSGVWGSEFGCGLLVFIEGIEVKHSLQGMGIGTKLFNRALDWVEKRARELGQPAEACSFLVTEPGCLHQDVVREFGEGNFDTGEYGERQAEVDAFRKKLTEKSIAFCRKQGFRRVGLSAFWAYATDPNHPSRQLTAEEDSKRDDIDPPCLTD